MNRLNCWIITLAPLLGSPLVHAQAPPPAAGTGAPLSPENSVIAQAKADVAAHSFAAAVTLLQAQPGLKTNAPLRHALADAQFAWGQGLLASSQFQSAIPHYQAAYDLDKVDRIDQSGNDVRKVGLAYLDLKSYSSALPYFKQALAIHLKVGDKAGQANALNDIGLALHDAGKDNEAIADYQQAVKLYGEVNDVTWEATSSFGLGDSYFTLKDYLEAIKSYQQGLSLATGQTTAAARAHAMFQAGVACCDLSQYIEAIDWFQQALPIFQQTNDSDDMAIDLSNMGFACDDLSQYTTALKCYQLALSIYEQTGDKDRQAYDLMNLGDAYSDLSQYANALDYLQQALAAFQQIGDKDDQAGALINLGVTCEHLSQYAKAIGYYQQALLILQKVGDADEQADDIMNLGMAYDDLGEHAKAIEYDQQALPLFQQAGDKLGQASDLMNTGIANNYLGQYAKAVDYYQQALPICQQAGDQDGKASGLMNMGVASANMGQFAQALSYYQQALPILQLAGDQSAQANDLMDMGAVWHSLSQDSHAISCYVWALSIDREVGDQGSQAKDLQNLMNVWQDQKKPRLAIFYGKQAINMYQTIRSGITKLDQQAQQTYLQSISNGYHLLAELLISQGRLSEAQQVLRMLKQQEFYDFLNYSQGQSSAPAPMDTIAATPHEQEWQDAYDKASAPLADIFTKEVSLARIKTPTPAQAQQLQSVQKQVTEVSAGIITALGPMVANSTLPATAADTLLSTAQEADLAAALTPGTVAVYTIVEPDKLDLIVVTPAQDGKASQQVYRSAPVTAAALYKQVYDFRSALTDPTTDPKPLGSTLYKEVFGPIQADLDSAHASTVLFSLDDALRYLPIAALYDDQTKQYVVQRYATAIFTLAGTADAVPAPSQAPLVLGAGVSQSLDGLPALPGVALEIGDIVRSPQNPDGLLPGAAVLDSAFTQTALLGDLTTQRFDFVHLASHFALRPSDTDSYLLMGDGSHLSVAHIAQDPHLFAGVDLLALSACDTDMEERSSTGKEVEGFGALAQQLGAKSVLASLWPVSDAATPLLMTAFYRDLKDHPDWPLPRVLQAAQLEMLTGSAAVAEQTVDSAHRGTEMINAPKNLTLPSFTAPANAPYAHPDYWAPFVLIGNWK